jgi:hypothetical protein
VTAGDAVSELGDLVSTETTRRYERWLAEPTGDDAYLYTDARVRFEVRDADVVVGAPGLTPHASTTGTRLDVPERSDGIDVPEVAPELVARFLDALDGERTLAGARRKARLDDETVRAIVRAAFGLVLFAPLAVIELERAIPSVEIVRFPGSPYEISRNYWGNMASVRKRVPRLLERASDPRAALEELRRLHAVALLGEHEDSFYRPASPIAKKGIFPSRLWLAPSRTLETEQGTRLLEGPRVGAKFLGGDRYGALVAELAGDHEATNERLEHRDEAGLDWGRVVVGSADGDTEAAPWFCPPRPLTHAHVESLFRSLGAALASRRDDAVSHLADFHQKFMRLHPFRAANQPLAMNVLNAVLADAGAGDSRGAVGIPHLILDHLSFLLVPEAYRKVFALAAREWTIAGSPVERARVYAERKRRYYELVERIARARDDAEARAIAHESPREARLALLVPSSDAPS